MPKTRGLNYTQREKNVLVHIIDKFKEVVENKKYDGKTIKKKQEIWKIITEEYNSTVERQRECKHLKVCYDNIKRANRKVSVLERSQKYVNTSSGESIYEAVKIEEREDSCQDQYNLPKTEEIVLPFCGNQVEPLSKTFNDAKEDFKDHDIIVVSPHKSSLLQLETVEPTSTTSSSSQPGSISTSIDTALKRGRNGFYEELKEYAQAKKITLQNNDNLTELYWRKKIELLNVQIQHKEEEHKKRLEMLEKEHVKRMEEIEIKIMHEKLEHKARMQILENQMKNKRS